MTRRRLMAAWFLAWVVAFLSGVGARTVTDYYGPEADTLCSESGVLWPPCE